MLGYFVSIIFVSYTTLTVSFTSFLSLLSGIPNTIHSFTSSNLLINTSSSSGNTFFPFFNTIMSFFLPVINIYPCLSIYPKSPV